MNTISPPKYGAIAHFTLDFALLAIPCHVNYLILLRLCSGIGPKLGVAILSGLPVAEFVGAVIGGDVVCLMPTKDSPNNITAMVAASIMFEIISVIASN